MLYYVNRKLLEPQWDPICFIPIIESSLDKIIEFAKVLLFKLNYQKWNTYI